MYETSGIHDDLMQIKNEIKNKIKNEIKNETSTEEIENLRKENYKYKNIIHDLISLNRNILTEILSKHYTYAVPITNIEIKPYTDKDFGKEFLEVVNIPLNDIIIRKFNWELDKIIKSIE